LGSGGNRVHTSLLGFSERTPFSHPSLNIESGSKGAAGSDFAGFAAFGTAGLASLGSCALGFLGAFCFLVLSGSTFSTFSLRRSGRDVSPSPASAILNLRAENTFKDCAADMN
jgi:hypothetical protein